MVGNYLVELLQDIPEAPQYELQSLSESGNFKILKNSGFFFLINGNWDILRNASYVRRVVNVLSNSEQMEGLAGSVLPEGKFYVRFQDSSDCHDSSIEPSIGDLLGGKGRVSFKDPDFVVRVYHLDSWYAGVEIFSGIGKELHSRRAPMRPFFSPISIDPRHARFMVNIAGTKEGETILDPFCGTGGILLEAGLMGRKVLGNDWSLQMTTGARLNLKYFGVRDYIIGNDDFLEMEIREPVAAIVTDFPYGKNSRLSQKNLEQLYGASFRKFHEILPEGRKGVVVVSERKLLDLAKDYFHIEKIFQFRVHRSLTRYFAVLKRK